MLHNKNFADLLRNLHQINDRTIEIYFSIWHHLHHHHHHHHCGSDNNQVW